MQPPNIIFQHVHSRKIFVIIILIDSCTSCLVEGPSKDGNNPKDDLNMSKVDRKMESLISSIEARKQLWGFFIFFNSVWVFLICFNSIIWLEFYNFHCFLMMVNWLVFVFLEMRVGLFLLEMKNGKREMVDRNSGREQYIYI